MANIVPRLLVVPLQSSPAASRRKRNQRDVVRQCKLLPMPVVETIINAIGSWFWRPMFGVFLASGVILFFHARLRISGWEQSNYGWLVSTFILSAGILLTYIGSAMHPWVARHVADWGMIHRGKKHLHQMSDDEKEHCGRFLGINGSSLHHNEANGALASLVERNILFTPGAPWGNGIRDFRIRPWALNYLKKHPELLK